ncbi:hypothetical protein [Actinoallomurus sp. CA-142502]|uniref:hypothetical protein n=1 Tax=Actinoallomurus sp. CA-142502 TaxID=3239885 RepID=UPI003D932FE7
MYTVLEVPARRLVAQAADHGGALHLLDAECRRLHDQAAADPDAEARTHRFEIVNAGTGRAVAWLTYSPDVARPYVSVLVDEMPAGERQ